MAFSNNRLAPFRSRARLRGGERRRGIIVPLFAITLPALLILCCVALNIAQFRVLRTELKVAADVSAHAAGRALSVYQDVDETIAFAQRIGGMNRVANIPFQFDGSQVVFGRSTRPNNMSRYSFTPVDTADVRNRTVVPNSVAIRASGNYPVLLAAISGRSTIPLQATSVATQVDRDIMLVLDKSGSMMEYKDDAALNKALDDLYRLGMINRTDYNNAKNNNKFSDTVHAQLTGDMKEYANDRRSSSTRPPRHSRWSQLKAGVRAFFDVIQDTDQTELAGLATFSSGATLNNTLSASYDGILTTVDGINPSGTTAIGKGMQTAASELFTSSRARPFAKKTIVVLTDGQNNVAPDPVTVARDIKNSYEVTIHTVTLSVGLNFSAMEQVASIGGGKHYHSDTGGDLVPIFQEIANNLPTLLTQ